MKIRITGTLEEVQGITEMLKAKEYIRSISQPYKNRGINNDYRLYIETYDLTQQFFAEAGAQQAAIKAEERKQLTNGHHD